jgi:ABC-type glycerol-3-phosphate transport system substrate-binding protein
MQEKSKNFQYIVLTVFIILAVISIAVFASGGGGGSKSEQPETNVVMWGTAPEREIRQWFENLDLKNTHNINIDYKEILGDRYLETITQSLASGVGPDIIFLPHDQVVKQSKWIFPIPYESYDQRAYLNSYIEEGELFLLESGILAFPLEVDPMVMYWNRDMFSSAGIANPPTVWSQAPSITSKINQIDQDFRVSKSAFALGEFNNINHAKEIISMLFLQIGNQIVRRGAGDFFETTLAASGNVEASPLTSLALSFYTDFVNPVKPVYSWNRSLPESQKAFLSGDLAIYFGFASEINELREKNPNLNFDVATVPQAEGQPKKTFANMTGLAILNISDNLTGAFRTINILTEDDGISAWSSISNLPPVRRSLLASNPNDAYQSVFYNSALISDAWLDPDYNVTKNIFSDMIRQITSGEISKVDDVLRNANTSLGYLFRASLPN